MLSKYLSELLKEPTRSVAAVSKKVYTLELVSIFMSYIVANIIIMILYFFIRVFGLKY